MKHAGAIGLAPPTPEKGAILWMPPTFPPRVSFRCAPRNPRASVKDDEFGENDCTVARLCYRGRHLGFTKETTRSSIPSLEVLGYQLVDERDVRR
jgi:hypothetical protein